jgi:exosome complex RNA-binding protein Rrp42 (RNase PH superfamily)
MPSKAGTLAVKVEVDNEVVSVENVDTQNISSYSFEVAGETKSKIKVYLNDVLYYEATADFGKDPVSVSDEKYHSVSFYVNVVGMSVNDAKSALNNAGYNNITIQEQESSENPGVVINQSPSQSSAPNLDKTATIVLTVSKNSSNSVVDPSQEETSENITQVQ